MWAEQSLLLIFIIATFLVIIIILLLRLRYFKKLSEMDELTAIPNYRGFRKKITKEIASNKKSFSIAIIDIDRFKRFNDQSYDLGDNVLKKFVEFIKDELPEDVYIARFRYGDEFILYFNCIENKAIESLQIIKNKCKNSKHFNIELPLSFSFGTANYSNGNSSFENLLKQAEKALKHNKQICEE
jgi:diguanylate cyclase (GGDEF)-like protein